MDMLSVVFDAVPVTSHILLADGYLSVSFRTHDFHSHSENPINTISHDGSMVLLYMVCHGSHQYTPFMLAYIPPYMDPSWV